MQNNGACSFIDINKLTVELEVTMKKTLKVAVIFALSFMFVVLGISISFTSFDRANAETTGSTSEGISTTDPTEPTTPIVIVPVIPVTTEPTVPTNPIESSPTQGEVGDIKWVLNDEKQLIISKNNTEEVCSTGNWSETYIEYKTVYTIDGGSFEIPVEKERRLDTPWSKCDYNSVIIEDGVTEIGACSFYSAEFEKISLPDSLMAIDKAAFRGAKTSAEFVFPPNLTDIGDAAFMYSGFNFGDSVLPESLSALGAYAFSGCSELESVDLSQSSVKDIKEYAFYNCKNLKSVTFPNQLESIGTSAFSNDGVYSCVVDVDNSSVGNLSFYAACVNVTSEDVIIPIYRLFTQQELDDMDTVDAAIQNLINTDSFATENEKISDINSLLLSLAENNDELGYALIQNNSICYSTEGKIFEFKYACGVDGVIDLSDTEGKDNGTESQTETVIQDNIISSAEGIYGTALLMDGFERSPFRDNYYNDLKNELDSTGLATDLVMDVTISDLENMENHDFIGICMHGSHPQNGHIILCTQEQVTAEKNELYAYELQLGIVKRSSHYWYTEELFEEFYNENSFEGSIIYLQNCCSLGYGNSLDEINYAMANTLINCGADTVIGNFNSILSNYNQKMMKMFIEELLCGSTTSTALSNCKDNY